MDHAKTKNGTPVTFAYHEQDPQDRGGLDKGFVVHRVDALIGGEVVGYLKISYVPSGMLPRVFPTPWHFARNCLGWCFNINDPVSTWFNCHWHMHQTPQSLQDKLPSYLRLSKDMAPDEATMLADLKALERVRGSDRHMTIGEMFTDWKRSLIDRPWVDHIRVPEPWQRQGIGTLLYEAGARWMATKGFPLWASSLRSDEALAAWEAMQEAGVLPISTRDRGDGKVLPVIDFRGREAA